MVKFHNNKWLVAFAVFTGAIMASIDTFVLYIATPHLRGVFSATITEISWITTAYAASSLIFMLLSRQLCLRHGTKTVYQTMLVLFICSSILCAFSETLIELILTRIVQGAAAGVLLPTENVILRRAFPKSEHGLAVGIYAATIMLGPSLGPLIGGYIIDNLHWSYIFYINVPIGIIGLILSSLFVEKDQVNNSSQFKEYDFLGAILLSVGIFCLIWLLERGGRLDWFEDSTNIWLGWVSAFCLSFFCAHEISIKNPLVDFHVLKFEIYRKTLFLKFILGFVVTGTLFLLPIFMQELLNFTPTKAGLSSAPRAIVMMICFPVFGYLVKRYEPRYFLLIGSLMGIYSAFLMTQFTHNTGINDMYLPQILQGVATALLLIPLTVIGLSSVSDDKLPAASGLDAFARVLGGILGVAILASLLTQYQEETWGVFRHDITLSKTELYRRFIRLQELWTNMGSNITEATQRGMTMLYGRILQQLLVISYMRSFQLIMLLFIGIMFITLFFNLKKSVRDKI